MPSLMKKIVSLMIGVILTIVLCGCNSHSDPVDNAATYIKAEILDANEKVLYSSSTDLEDVPILKLQNDYFLRLHIGPGARFLPYESTTILCNENEIAVQEIEGMDGELYLLSGVGVCSNSKLEIAVVESILTNAKIKCFIYVCFE